MTKSIAGTLGTAVFSDDEKHRYLLTRFTGVVNERRVAFVGLNPSTATADVNDPTIRRCLGYAERWGFGHLDMLNLFSWRSTDPRGLLGAPEPDGGETNFDAIVEAGRRAEVVIAAWGGPYQPKKLQAMVDGCASGVTIAFTCALPLAGKLRALTLTKDGHPRHPLYLKADLEPMPYVEAP